jgi:alpha-galactosidase
LTGRWTCYHEGSVTFKVWIDGRCLEQTRVLRYGDHSYLNVAIPPGGKTIRLVVTDAGDGITCDHGDWANAGFLLHP